MNNLIEVLHEVSTKLTDVESEVEIYQIMNDGIKQILPNSYFVITTLQPDDMNFRIIHSFGFDKYLSAIKTILGKDPFQMDFPFADLSEKKQIEFESRKVYHAPGGVYEIANGRVNKIMSKTIEKILGISEVYAISFCIEDKYFGGSVLFNRKTNAKSDKLSQKHILTIESMTALASFAINKLRDLEILSKNEKRLKKANKLLEFQNEEKTTYLEELSIAKEKSEEQRKLLSIMARNFPNSFVSVINKDLTIGFTSGEEFYKNNLNPTDYIGLSLDVVFGDKSDFIKKQYLKAIKGERVSFELDIDNRHYLFKVVPLNETDQEITQILAVVENITDQKLAEQIRLTNEESLRLKNFALENSSNAIAFLNDKGIITYINKGYLKLFGYNNKSEIIGQSYSEFTSNDCSLQIEFDRLINEKAFITEGQPIRKDGTSFHSLIVLNYFTQEKKAPLIMITFVDITEIKKLENELKKSISLLSATLESTADGILVVDKDGKITSFNKKFRKLWKIPDSVIVEDDHDEEKLMPIALNQLSDPESFIIKVKEMYLSAVKSFDVLNFKDGRVYERYSQPQLLDGEIVGRVWSFRDVTERKQAADELLKAKEKYKIITQASLDVIFIVDNKGKIIFSNDSMESVLGYQPNEFLGQSFTHFVPKKEIINYFRKLVKVFKHQEIRNFYTQIYHKEGHLVDVEINGKLIQHEGKLAAQGTIRDISLRLEAEEALKESEEQHRFLFENTPSGVIYFNSEGDILQANKAAEKILGIPFSHMLKRKTFGANWEAKHENGTPYTEEELPAMITLKTGKPIKNAKMCFFNPKSNSEVVININSLPKYKSNETKPYQVVVTFEDISKEKKTEQLLKSSNATKDKFFSIIAHDLRSPFNSIIGISEMIIEDPGDFEAEEIEKFLSVINSSAKNTLAFLDNLLNWARSQTGQISFNPEKIIFSTIIQESIALLDLNAKNKNILIRSDYPEEMIVFGDLNMLKTILRNLISNAIKFTNLNGKIDIVSTRKNEFIEISVSDNGVGMSEESRAKLFCLESSTTTSGTANEKGSGLGLILCKEFVEKHGGEIWAESKSGMGSVFKFTLPINDSIMKK